MPKFLDNLVGLAKINLFDNADQLSYLTSGKRKLPLEVIERFNLGFMGTLPVFDDGSKDYKNFVSKFDYNGEATSPKKLWDGRIVLPVQDCLGKNIGALFRYTGTSEEKTRYQTYFSRAADDFGALYGLHQAMDEIHRTKVVYVVEGSFDTLATSMVAQNVVSSMTNFINAKQFAILDMIAEKIVLLYDGDDKGKSGAKRVQFEYKSSKIVVKEIPFKDPGRGLEFFGLEKFKSIMSRYTNVRA